MIRGIGRVVVWLVALASVHGVAFAEDKEPPVYPLEFKTGYELPNGKVSTWQGMAKPAPGDRFITENVLVLQPIVVTVVAKHKGDKIHVALAKSSWDEKLKEGTTGADGKAILKTRTQGDLRVIVTSADGGDPKPYYLIVWIGDEIKPELTPVTTSMKTYKGGTAMPGSPGGTATGGNNKTAIVIAVLLGIGILILILKLKKRGMQ
ncbi:MAG TPA: hypothetical protein VIV40_22820 [Kofleriaceae bacterium]